MQLFANLLVLLSLFSVAIADNAVVARQNTAPDCLDYAMTANMSTIGTNGTYRSAFLIKSPMGTIPNARMFSAAQAKLPALTADLALNQRCGNLTQVAITEAASNFTNGIVAQFTTEGLPTGIENGPMILVIVGIISITMSSVWLFSE